ncbi:MAG: LTA synthase family protein [Lachnospiraceae bacterium]|nr:LTA synthase family protein [Lachnospiraceae bacterium]
MKETDTGRRQRRLQAAARGIGTALIAVLLIYFFMNPSVSGIVQGEGTVPVSLRKTAYVLILAAAGLLFTWIPCRLSEKSRRRVAAVMSFLTTVGTIFVLEYANIHKHRGPLALIRAIGKKKFLLTWIVLALILLWLLILTNCWQIASVLLTLIECIFGLVCYFVFTLRGVPFLASDLTILQTAANVAGEYRYSLDYHSFLQTLFTVAWCDVLLWTGFSRVFTGWKVRSAGIILAIAGAFLFNKTYFHTSMLRDAHVTLNTFRPQKSYGSNGSILTFLRSIQLMIVEVPENYSREAVEEIASRYPEEAAEGEDSLQPNVLIIMDEAFTDMQSWMDFETDQEVCPYFAGLKENTIRGKLYVSSYGGRTANTEYEVLTGDCVGFLPPSSTPYQLYIKDDMPNLNSALEIDGYRHTVGMHPYLPSGYNRDNVYGFFGFDQKIFLDEFKGASTVWGRVSDDADIDKVIAEYEEARDQSDAPFFIHNVTMQNHSPYTAPADELGDPVHVVSDVSFPDADTYLTEIRKSDKALEKLVTYFESVDEPTVIVFFGDHQPKLSDDFYRMVYGKTMDDMKGEELMQFYHSNYLIWANFDIEEQQMDLSSNYLIPVMKQAVGMELTGYDRFLLDLHEDLPVVSLNGYWDADGSYYEDVNDSSSPWYDTLQEYNLLVYNHLFGKDDRIAGFFEGIG